ncbi:MAG: trypsin-like peptidase domain-containing protein [Planctomycetales bacterium]|nr:trypsin-like peptidase domain-containing protein [Planctomycetales bacterium]
MAMRRVLCTSILLVILQLVIVEPPVVAQGISALREREKLVQQVCQNVLRSVVSVDGASGVVISEDGVVLTQFHVSHANGEGDTKGHPIGTAIPLVFSDDKATKATLLGGDVGDDLGLVKIVDGGPFDFTELDPKASVALGGWVLKFGHPKGWRSGRPPVVRLGRVIRKIDTELVTDCHVTQGDSGGPYFDLSGKLVGMIYTGSVLPVPLPENMRMRTQITWSVVPSNIIGEKIPMLLRGEINRETKVRFVDELYASEDRLDFADWKHGNRSLAEWKEVIEPARQNVVRILDDETQVALGTVVDTDGHFVTRASAVPLSLKCFASTGEALQDVALVGVSPEYDLALLKTSSFLKQSSFCKQVALPIGTFQAVPGHGELPLAVGIVSVAERRPKGKFRTVVVHDERAMAEPPEWTTIPIPDHGMVIVAVEGNAAKAGFEPADELVQLGETSIREPSDVLLAIEDRFARDRILATVIRKSKRTTLELELDNGSEAEPNTERDDSLRIVPVMYEHDAPVAWHECGGPIVDLDGNVTGVTIARLGDYGCIAIPALEVQRIAHVLLSQ